MTKGAHRERNDMDEAIIAFFRLGFFKTNWIGGYTGLHDLTVKRFVHQRTNQVNQRTSELMEGFLWRVKETLDEVFADRDGPPPSLERVQSIRTRYANLRFPPSPSWDQRASNGAPLSSSPTLEP